jgi:RES domain-containing protein
MQLYRIGKCRYIDDTSGQGAALYGGRWNSVGTKVLYTANSAALAMLEALVNLPNLKIRDPYCIVVLEVPENSIKEISIKDLPDEWNNLPAPEILKRTGDAFTREGKYLLLKVPSALLPSENNYLINPLHKDFSKIIIIKKDIITFDKRLLK